jgi:hypothetical protein
VKSGLPSPSTPALSFRLDRARFKRLAQRLEVRILLSLCGRRSAHPNFVRDELGLYRKIPDINKSIGIVNRMRCIRRGFNSDKYLIYSFGGAWEKCPGYLTDYDRTKHLEALGWPYYYVAHDKLVFEKYFADKCNVVSSSHLIYRGRVYPLNDAGNAGIRTVEDLVMSTTKGADYILKPVKGSGGTGVFGLSCPGDDAFLVNGVRKSREEACRDIAGLSEYLVAARFVQAGYAHDVFPDTLNTLRVVTMFDSREGTAFVPLAVHRFGTKRSVPVDNIDKGGFAVTVDVDTGTMGIGYNITAGVPRAFSTHPDTGITFTGLAIPGWTGIKDTMVRLANYIPQLPLCGWDVVLSGRELYVLELNYNPGLFQFFRPYLTIPRVRELLEYYGVVSRAEGRR